LRNDYDMNVYSLAEADTTRSQNSLDSILRETMSGERHPKQSG